MTDIENAPEVDLTPMVDAIIEDFNLHGGLRLANGQWESQDRTMLGKHLLEAYAYGYVTGWKAAQ